MRLIRTLCCTLLALTTTVCAGEIAQAAETNASATDHAAYQNYRLTMDFVDKWIAVQLDPNTPACGLLFYNFPEESSLAEMTKILDARPGVTAALAKHDLTAREALLGSLGILAARLQALEESSPSSADDESDREKNNFKVSAANMAFIRQHGTAIHQSMAKAGQQLLRANGGKLPKCATE